MECSRTGFRKGRAFGAASPMLLLAGALLFCLSQSFQAEAPPRSFRSTGQPHPVHTCRPVIAEIKLHAGESKRVSLRNSLDLMIEAVPHGWAVRVLPTSGPQLEVDFAELATPPYRSINPLLLTTAFGMRAQDVIGWNPRTFRYLPGRAGLPAAIAAYHAVLSTKAPTPQQQSAVAAVAAGAAEGRIDILDARLIPGTADQSPAAVLIATHFSTTAHELDPPGASASPLGQVTYLRLRATLQPAESTCPTQSHAVQARSVR